MSARLRLGNTELDVHPLCLGGNVFGWTADETRSFELLDAYVEAGGNFIDTADVYSAWVPGHTGGESETVLGRWIKRRGHRDDLVIATKVGAKGGLSQENVAACTESSCRRLQVDHIDLLYAHVDDPTVPLDETVAGFDALVRRGLARHLGASNYSSARLLDFLAIADEAGLTPFSVVQSHYNLLERDRILDEGRPAEPYEPRLQDLCGRHNLAFVPYWVLAKGFLTGKYRGQGAMRSESSRAEIHRVNDYAGERAAAILDALEAVARSHDASIAAVTLAWTAAQPAVATPLASARTVEQLGELVAFGALHLRPEELAAISAASAA